MHGYVLGSTDVKRLPTCRRVVDDDSGFVHPLDLVIKVHGLFRKVLQVDLNLDEVSVNGFLDPFWSSGEPDWYCIRSKVKPSRQRKGQISF